MINPPEHFAHLRQLLQIEREEDRNQYQQKIRNRSIKDRIEEGVCWYPVEVRKSYVGIGEKWILEMRREGSQNRRHMFQAGSTASLFVQDGKQVRAVNGIVSRITEERMTLMLNRDEPPEWLETGRMGMDLLFDESSYEEMDRTLVRLQNVKEGRLKDLVRIGLGLSIPEFTQEQPVRSPSLNESQNEALSRIRAATDWAIIHGPPGTGKTTTLVKSIEDCVAIEKQVLVCAPSNAAVDLIVEKLHKAHVNVLRLGHPARVTEEVLSHTLDAQIARHPDMKQLKDLRKRSEEMRRLGRQYKRRFGREEAVQRKQLMIESRRLKEEAHLIEDHIIYDLLNQAAVIACTLVGATTSFLENRRFKTVFVDESSQALEPAAWIPILRSERVIMAGDHLQLPPTVKSKEALEKGLGTTLFERCIESYPIDVMLAIQYRMSPEILQFSNERFYKGAIKTDVSVLERKPIFEEHFSFIDTAGCGFDEKVNPETLSTYNPEEAEFVVNHMHELVRSIDVPVSIGVIAPYKAQIELLRSLAGSMDWGHHSLTINTVDAFQGQERDVVGISMTRCNTRGEIGFLSDRRRMNVAITRARRKLVIIGDSATLGSDPFYSDLIDFSQSAGGYHSAFEYQTY